MKSITKKLVVFFFIMWHVNFLFAQNGIIKGKIYNELNNEPISYANVGIKNTTLGTTTDENGLFEITNLQPGYYNIQISFVGYKAKNIYEIQVFNSKPSVINVGLKESTVKMAEVVATAPLFAKTEETPMCIRSLGVAEIQRSPGGGRDISRVIQTLPGVASSPASNRNDIIIRGGGPAENKFYIDGFKVNTINHFTTQGATGGFWGMIDANQIRQMNLITGAFPSRTSDALSSVFDIKLKEGSTEKLNGQLTLGIIQRGFNANGHIGKKTTFLVGARQSNFELLFGDRAIIPEFKDFLFKSVTQINKKNKIELFGFGAIDDLNINTDVEKNGESIYSLERVRELQQWTYTAGIKWTHSWEKGYSNLYFSQNVLDNTATKHQDNNPDKRMLLDYNSNETENALVISNNFTIQEINIGFGANYEYSDYSVDNFILRVNTNGINEIKFSSDLNIHKYGLYANASKNFFNNIFTVALGIRADANNYSNKFSNLLNQLSPRLSMSYTVNEKIKINANTGIYYQNPSYTSLGFIENDKFVNKENLKPIQSIHYVIGTEYLTTINSSISIEGFYKKYNDYPFSVSDGISLANKGAGFGVYGAEELISISEGQSYGFELMYQQKLYKGFYGIISYTFVKSEFENAAGNNIASSWDYGNILSTTIGKRFKNNWEIGAKWVYYGGMPYTPYDEKASAIIENWDVAGRGILDYSKLNQERTDSYHQLDIRIDKKFYFKKWNMNLYVDLQNLYNYEGGVAPDLILDRDDNFNSQINPQKTNSYLTKIADAEGFGFRPDIGIIIEF